MLKDEILDIIADVCEEDDVREDLSLDLFEEGLLDSLGVAQLLMELEDKLGIDFGEPEGLQNVGDVVKHIDSL